MDGEGIKASSRNYMFEFDGVVWSTKQESQQEHKERFGSVAQSISQHH
jgi:hypothetical protein